MRKPRKASRDVERDMAIARAVSPVEVGGGGLLHREAAEKFGLSTQRVQQIVNEPDVKEAHKSWLQKMFSKQRSTGDRVQAAFEALVEAGDARVVIDYFRRMGVDVGPGIDVNISELKLVLPEGVSDLLKLNPAYERGVQDAGFSDDPEGEFSHKVESVEELRNLDAEVNDRIEEGAETEGSAAPGTGE